MALSEPTWPFTGAQVVDAIRVKVAALDEMLRISEEDYRQRYDEHQRALSEWKKLPERKRGGQPMFGDEAMAHMSHMQWLRGERGRRIAEVDAYALDLERVFYLTVDDIAHFGLGDTNATRTIDTEDTPCL